MENLEVESGRYPGEPKIDWHHRMYDAMVAYHARTGKWVDPVSQKEFPKGQMMTRYPNRKQQRNLDKFRRQAIKTRGSST